MEDLMKNISRVHELEEAMQDYPPVNCETTHNFIPGFYIRTIYMPKDTLITSQTHITEHPFFVSKGKLKVLVNDGEWEEIEAPYAGVTFPGTKRVLVIIEDCVWTTFHPIPDEEQPASQNEEEIEVAVQKIWDRIIDHVQNPLLSAELVNNKKLQTIQNY